MSSRLSDSFENLVKPYTLPRKYTHATELNSVLQVAPLPKASALTLFEDSSRFHS